MKIPKEIIKELLLIRNALIEKDIDEAYYILYKLADPKFESLTPWKEWEEISK